MTSIKYFLNFIYFSRAKRKLKCVNKTLNGYHLKNQQNIQKKKERQKTKTIAKTKKAEA